ncbi:hypothetical protein ACHAW5_002080 [Stephanodiscus triporus]|uniref:Uncharacterized protein n=1 Tax=Stephanodiscus triporus TaxID=2934178 RepID=A0ABD3MUE3_9STRA
MAKTKSNRRGGGNRGSVWTNADHDARTAKRLASMNKKRLRDDNDDGTRRKEKRQRRREDGPPRRTRPGRRSGGDAAARRLSTRVPDGAYKRTHLAHDDVGRARLRLVAARLQRKADALRTRLEDWDPLEDAERRREGGDDYDHDDYDHDDDDGPTSSSSSTSAVVRRMELDAANRRADVEARERAASELAALQARHGVNSSTHRRKSNLRRRPRPGPEGWKLRGAARPAHEVYDFDVRHVDVHRMALDEANARARRVVNVIEACRGRFASDDGDGDVDDGGGKAVRGTALAPPQPQCRRYLSLLTQLGSIQLHRGNHSSARKAFLEAIELEGYDNPNSITNARYRLMNMYLSCNRPNSARGLWEKLRYDDSAWIRYSAALIEYVSWNLLGERGSTAEIAEAALARAIRGNVYVAYLLGWSQTFEKAMEYTDEVVESGIMVGKESGSLLEAIEYGCRCYSSSSAAGNGKEMPGNDDDDDDKDVGMAMWLGTEGSLDWVRSVVLRVLNGDNDDGEEGWGRRSDRSGTAKLTKADLLCWEGRLNEEEEEFERQDRKKKGDGSLTKKDEAQAENESDDDDGDDCDDASGQGDDDDDFVDPDVPMYAGMFRTAMDWLQDAGEFLKEPSFDYVRRTRDETSGEEDDATSVGGDNEEEEKGDSGTSVHDDDHSSEDNDSSSNSSA